jgi:hypothetical protein
MLDATLPRFCSLEVNAGSLYQTPTIWLGVYGWSIGIYPYENSTHVCSTSGVFLYNKNAFGLVVNWTVSLLDREGDERHERTFRNTPINSHEGHGSFAAFVERAAVTNSSAKFLVDGALRVRVAIHK